MDDNTYKITLNFCNVRDIDGDDRYSKDFTKAQQRQLRNSALNMFVKSGKLYYKRTEEDAHKEAKKHTKRAKKQANERKTKTQKTKERSLSRMVKCQCWN